MSLSGPEVASRYEALRAGGLGLPVAPMQRAGLTVLLRCGLWAWVRSMSVDAGPARLIAGPVAERTAAVRMLHLFADLTLAPTGRTR